MFPSPEAGRWDEILAVVGEADRRGLEWVGIQDHPYQRRFLDTLALISFLAARTERVGFFPDVACLPLRHPAVLAKTAISIDVMSGGRFELGLGAGAFWDAIEAMGGPRRSPGEALGALADAIEVIRLVWGGDRGLRFEGEHYRVDGLHGGPRPAHDIGIWLGVTGPRALGLLGRSADGWVPSIPRVPLDQVDDKQARIDEAASEAGRDPRAIRRLCNVNGVITDGDRGGFLHGPPEQWVEELGSLAVDHGLDTFILWPEADPVEQVRRLSEVAPRVRELVESHRR